MQPHDQDMKGSAAPAGKRIIVVLGMHRSGTSVITRGLRALGVELGENLLPPVPGDNEKGYFEDADVNALNNELLECFGHVWNTLRHAAPEVMTGAPEDVTDRAVKLLQSKTRDRELFGLKDPRITVLLPFWQKVFARLNLDAGYVIAVRHPLSVARSLARHDNSRGYVHPVKSHCLWLVHVIAALRHTCGCPRVVVDYDLFLDDPGRHLRRMAEALDLPRRVPDEEYLRDYLETRLRHSRFGLEDLQNDPDVISEVRDMYDLLLKLAEDDLTENDPQVSQIIERTFSGIRHIDPLLGYLDMRDRRISLLAPQLDQCRSHNAWLMERQAWLEQHAANLEQHAAGLEEHAAHLRQAVVGLEGQIAALQASLSWRVTRPLRWLADRAGRRRTTKA